MELFAISCTTCQARLKVRDPSAIGKILACPKCGSMVQVAAPSGWTPPSAETINKIAAEASSGNTVAHIKPMLPRADAPSVPRTEPSQPADATPPEPAQEPIAVAAKTEKVPSRRAASTKQSATPAEQPQPSAPTVASPAPTVAATPPTVTPATVTPATVTTTAPAGASAAAADGPGVASRVLSALSEHRLVLLTAPVVLLVLALFAWIIFRPAIDATEGLSSAPQIAVAPTADAHAPTDVPPVADIDHPAVPDADAVPPAVADGDHAPQAPGAGAQNESGDVAARRSEESPRNLADLAAEGNAAEGNAAADENAAGDGNAPQGQADEAAAEAPAEDAATAANHRKPPAAGPGHLGQPIVPFGAAPAGDALPATAPDAATPAEESDGDMVVGHESMPPVDVAARLDDPLPAVQFKRITLLDFCDFLSRLSTIPITLDTDALELVNVHPGDQVSLALEDTTVGNALTEVLAKRGLMFLVEGQQLIVTSPDRKAAKPASVSYDVRDLAGQGGNDIAGVMTLVTRFVSPGRWQENGGQGHAKLSDGMLLVEQDPITQREVALFLDKLRQARGLVLKGNLKPEDVTLKSMYDRAKENLDKTVTANFSLESPLVDVLAWLSRATATRFVIDEASLAQAGLWSQVPATVVAEKQPLYEVLSALLSPIGMTYRIVDERTLQVFARQAQADRMECEIYSLKDLLAARLDASEIVERLRKQFDPASWTEGGGLGAIQFDEPSQSLLVVQTPEAQIRLENMLLRQTGGAPHALTPSFRGQQRPAAGQSGGGRGR